MILKEKNIKRFSDYIPYAGLIGDQFNPGIAITKNGLLLRTFLFSTKDLSFSSDAEIFDVFKNLNNSFRFFGAGHWSLYIDAFRTKRSRIDYGFRADAPQAARDFDHFHRLALGSFYHSEYFLTFAFNPYSKNKLNSLFFNEESSGNDDGLRSATSEFINITDDLYNMLSNVFNSVEALDNDQTMTFYHRCVSTSSHPVKTPEIPFYLDYYLSDSRFVPDSITKLDDDYIHTVSLHDFPAETRPDMVTSLMSTDAEFRFSVRFAFLSKDEARKKIKNQRRAHFQKRKGIGSLLSEAVTKEENSLEDTEALSYTADSSEALSSLSEGDTFFGHITTTVVVSHPSYEEGKKIVRRLKKVINEHGYIAKDESFNNPLAFLGTFHGNLHYNSRSPLVSTRNLTHFFPLSEPWPGNQLNDHLGEVSGVSTALMVVRSGNSQFFLNLNIGDVGHTLVVGSTGSGKSIFLNTIALQYLRYPESRIVFFDKDRSSQWACRNAGGTFLDLGDDSCDFRLNPFSAVDDKRHRLWLSQFFSEYFSSKKIALSPSDNNEILGALESMQGMKTESLSFATFQQTIQNEEIRRALNIFVDGEYSRLFAPIQDDISTTTWITFEMNTLMQMGDDIVRFVLGYLFYKLQHLFNGNPTLLVLDEAWLFLDNPYFSEMLRDWLKTLRKKNVYVVLATQEMADARSSIFSTIVNACMTKIFLPNNQAFQSDNRALYQDLGLDESDLYTLVEAMPRRHYLYFSPRGKQLFELCLDDNQLSYLKSFKEIPQ